MSNFGLFVVLCIWMALLTSFVFGLGQAGDRDIRRLESRIAVLEAK